MNVFRKGILAILFAAIVVATAIIAPASTVDAERAKDVRWRGRVIRIAVSNSFFAESSAIKSGSDINGALKRSLESWEAVINVKFEIVESSKQNVSAAGNSGDGVSLLTIAGTAENTLFLGKTDSGLPAATRVFYDRKGNITESDIVLNPTEQFSTDGTFGTYDLESVLVHEIGHLLGLPHIEFAGATMVDSIQQNGLFGMASTRTRSLSEIDASMARVIYGNPLDASECCGVIVGIVTLTNGRPARRAEIFLESAVSGRVFGLGKTDSSGRVTFSSVPAGDYRLVSANAKSKVSPDRLVSESVSLAADEEANVSLTIPAFGSSEKIVIGSNGQLASSPIPYSIGVSGRIHVGLPAKFVKDLVVSSTSSAISVVKDSIEESSDYDGLRVISFEIEVQSEVSDGEYSLVLSSEDLGTVYLPGIISIDRQFDLVQLQPRRVFE